MCRFFTYKFNVYNVIFVNSIKRAKIWRLLKTIDLFFTGAME